MLIGADDKFGAAAVITSLSQDKHQPLHLLFRTRSLRRVVVARKTRRANDQQFNLLNNELGVVESFSKHDKQSPVPLAAELIDGKETFSFFSVLVFEQWRKGTCQSPETIFTLMPHFGISTRERAGKRIFGILDQWVAESLPLLLSQIKSHPAVPPFIYDSPPLGWEDGEDETESRHPWILYRGADENGGG